MTGACVRDCTVLYASYDLRRKIEMQHEEFQKMTEESMKNPGAVVMLPSRITCPSTLSVYHTTGVPTGEFVL